METHILEIKKNPLEWVKRQDHETIVNVLKTMSEHYYNSDIELVDDTIFDMLVDFYNDKWSTKYAFIGADINDDKNKAKLPCYMGSMDKTKVLSGLEKWILKQPPTIEEFVKTPKIDGTSSLIVFDLESDITNIYTRGNGVEGKKLSFLVEHLFPKELKQKVIAYLKQYHPTLTRFICRGEMSVSKSNFKEFSSQFTSARSMVNGLTNKKDYNANLSHQLEVLDFMLFEMIEPKLCPSDQFTVAKECGFKVVNFDIISKLDLINDTKKEIQHSIISKTLENYRQAYEYDIDGIIITSNLKYDLPNVGNPEYSIAFKINQYGKQTKIVNIEWNVSKHGLLIPTLIFESILLGSSRVSKCTGFNGAFVFKHSLGSGAIIRVILSGEVIPYIAEIVSGANVPQMPICGYKWNETKVHCQILEESSELAIQRITTLIKTIKIDHLAEGMVTHLYSNGFTSIKAILQITREDLLKLDRIEDKMATRILKGIHDKIGKPIALSHLMDGSLSFGSGFGGKRCNQLILSFPDFLEMPPSNDDLIKLPGWSDKTATKFLNGLPKFKAFMDDNSYLIINPNPIPIDETLPKLDIKKVCVTGKRNPDIISFLSLHGVEISSSVTNDIDMLICEDPSNNSGKITQAIKRNKRIMSITEFMTMYNI